MAARVGSPGTGGSWIVSAPAQAAGNSNGARPATANGPSRLARRGMGGAGGMFATIEQLDSGTPVVRVIGELDRATVQALEQTLLGLGEDLAGALIVDLTGCTCLDSSGLAALITTRRRLHRSSRRLALVLSTPGALSIFQITALDQLFEIYPTLGAALDRNHNGGGMQPQVDPARPESTRG